MPWKSDETIYEGDRAGLFERCTIIRREPGSEGRPLLPGASLKVWNHSPTGFNWGYCGSGPAQTALALCLDFMGGDAEGALGVYQYVKFDLVAKWGDRWTLTGRELSDAITRARLQRMADEGRLE